MFLVASLELPQGLIWSFIYRPLLKYYIRQKDAYLIDVSGILLIDFTELIKSNQ